jgi:Pyridoxamine 5'-phosphate oxidase
MTVTKEEPVTKLAGRRQPETEALPVTSEQIWHEMEKGSFAVVSYVTPAGAPRASGVMYKVVDRRLYVVVAPDSWKAKHIARDGRVAMTIPVRRGGLLSLVFPIPPATISFHGKATVHAGDSPRVRAVVEQLGDLLPAERRASSSVIEIVPEGWFVTYGIGVSLNEMRDPQVARARVPVM